MGPHLEVLLEHPAGHLLERVDELGHRDLRWVLDQQL
jgi:hypothetical protein